MSVTEKRISGVVSLAPARSARTSTFPRLVNFTAFPTRFTSTWRSRSGSPASRVGVPGSTRQVSSSPFSLPRGAISSPTVSRTYRRSNGISSRSTFPDSSFEMSRMSFRIERSESPATRIVSIESRCRGSSASSRRRPVIPITAFIGVRISWLMLARNSAFARPASSAARWASTARRSASFWEEMSTNPQIR